MQDILTAIATSIEVASFFYFGLSFVQYAAFNTTEVKLQDVKETNRDQPKKEVKAKQSASHQSCDRPPINLLKTTPTKSDITSTIELATQVAS